MAGSSSEMEEPDARRSAQWPVLLVTQCRHSGCAPKRTVTGLPVDCQHGRQIAPFHGVFEPSPMPQARKRKTKRPSLTKQRTRTSGYSEVDRTRTTTPTSGYSEVGRTHTTTRTSGYLEVRQENESSSSPVELRPRQGVPVKPFRLLCRTSI